MAPKLCIDCPFHKIINDPDPIDWFCTDDVAIVCTKTPNPDIKRDSKYAADHSIWRPIQVGIRPYRVEKECNVPEWCPKNNSN